MNNLITRAFESKEKLELIYIDSDGQLSQRIIRVVKMDHNGLLAYCYSKQQVRSFKKENILSVYPYQSRKKMEA
ncbi:hypothetical protein [Halobacillus seohaensis]|uniref:WYL domain-containing protein n=1 Tax=Halobacillus seohaensis TaxID=447421 RepID=A0ABW2EEY6_9BACI